VDEPFLSVVGRTLERMSEAFSVPEEDRPAVLAGTAEWVRCCPPGGMPGSPEVLAGRVEAALDRADRLMFVVTPREELDAAARWQLVADQAWCGQLRGVVASTARMDPEDRDFAGDELALALGMSSGAGRRLVWQYGSIAALPGLVEAVESGRLTRRHLLALTDQLDAVDLTLEQRQAVALICLARDVDQTPAGWAELARRVILTVDPQAAQRRRDVAAGRRRVVFFPHADQQGAIWLQAPVEAVAPPRPGCQPKHGGSKPTVIRGRWSS